MSYSILKHKTYKMLLDWYMLHKIYRILLLWIYYYIHIILLQNQSSLMGNRSFKIRHSMFLSYLLDKMCINSFSQHKFHKYQNKSYKHLLHYQYIWVYTHIHFPVEFWNLNRCMSGIDYSILHYKYSRSSDRLIIWYFNLPTHSVSNRLS